MSMELEQNSYSRAISAMEGSRLNIISTNQQTIDHSSGAARVSSKFKGVLCLRSGKWGARIAFNYKAFWLGTYDMEEEAAMAYDRAAIKLKRGDSPLNFPMTFYTVQETKFLIRHSSEDILAMIKNKTYLPKLTDYLQHQSLFWEWVANQQGVSYEMLFQKELTQTDVAHIKGFHIPKEYALRYFSPLAGVNSSGGAENENMSTELTFLDKSCCPWTFRYCYWRSTRTFVFTRGWRHFLNMHNLKPKDSVIFYRCLHQRGAEERVFYMIDFRRSNMETNAVTSEADMEHNAREISNDEYAEDMEENERGNGVMLFGVRIGN